MLVPIVETERLILRGFKLDDFDAYSALWSDPEVTRHIGDGSVKSREEAWTSFLRHAGHWQMLGFGSWNVEEKATGRPIGYIGFNERHRDRGTAYDALPEVGWMFARSASGKGYATESLDAVLQWGRANLGAVRVVAVVAPDNIASLRVAEKCGFEIAERRLSLGRARVFCVRAL